MHSYNLIKNSSKNIFNKPFTAISLFAGAGGMDIGFKNQGFKIIWANDIDKDACSTYRTWSNSFITQGDINKIDLKTIPASDIILGSFPCQGFSVAGPRKTDDKRNQLYWYFVKLVEQKCPIAFVTENVKGMITIENGKIFNAIVTEFRCLGYELFYKLINAADYGVPQDRQRVFIVGLRKDYNLTFNLSSPDNTKVTLMQALSNVPKPSNEDICNEKYSSRYMSRNRKRNWDNVSFTIPAMAKQVPLHPSSPDMIKLNSESWAFGDGLSRRFSWKEAAAIQTFPLGFEFCGNLTSKYRQIGNAVPIRLAEVIAQSLLNTLNQ